MESDKSSAQRDVLLWPPVNCVSTNSKDVHVENPIGGKRAAGKQRNR